MSGQEEQLAGELEEALRAWSRAEGLTLWQLAQRSSLSQLARAVAEQLLAAREERRRLAEAEFGLPEARAVAADWHNGQGSALYALSSGGLAGGREVLEGAELEAERELRRQPSAQPEERERLALLVTWLGLMIRGEGERQ